MGYPINPAAIFDFANQTVHTDTYTFDKRTYKQARNFDPAANAEYQKKYLAERPRQTAKATASSARKNATITVRRGDTLSKIASRNGTTVKQLCRLNGIKTTSKLTPGKKLRVK